MITASPTPRPTRLDEAAARAVTVCLHGGAIALRTDRLAEADERLLRRLTTALPGAEVNVVELCASPGASPGAVRAALSCGARRALRVVDAALSATDPHAAAQAWRSALGRWSSRGPAWVVVAQSADPEGPGVSSAPLAKALGLPHLAQVEELAWAPRTAPPGTIRVRVRTAASRLELDLKRGLLATVLADEPMMAPVSRPEDDVTPSPHILEVASLADLGIPAALIRRSDDLAGQLRPFARSFVRCEDLGSLTASLRTSRR